MDTNSCEDKTGRWRRQGMVDAMVDCLALLQQDWLRRAIQQRVAEAGSCSGVATGTPEERLVCEGTLDSYLACQRWIGQGLDDDALAGRILQRIFAVWPCEAADYQLRYDEFLEKELENPRATYYLSSQEWMAAVEELRAEVARARELGQPPSEKSVRRCLKLLLTHSPRPPGSTPNTIANIPANLPAGRNADAGAGQQPGLAT